MSSLGVQPFLRVGLKTGSSTAAECLSVETLVFLSLTGSRRTVFSALMSEVIYAQCKELGRL